VSWNSKEASVATPFMHTLALNGMRLHQHYAHPVCSPSRAALLTGFYSSHTKIKQPLFGVLPLGLDVKFKLLPQYLKELDYRTYAVGK